MDWLITHMRGMCIMLSRWRIYLSHNCRRYDSCRWEHSHVSLPTKLRKQQMTYEPFRGSFFSITIIIKTIKTMTKYQFLLKKRRRRTEHSLQRFRVTPHVSAVDGHLHLPSGASETELHPTF